MNNEMDTEILTAIQDNNVNYFQVHGYKIVNRVIEYPSTIPINNKSLKCPFSEISKPTTLILAILYEAHEILRVLLENSNPDLQLTVNGWYPIHFAASTGDPTCLYLLLQTQYYQENIDIPIKEPFLAKELHSTTALHVAATNRCHAQALMLLQELPEIAFTSQEDDHDEDYQSADVMTLSSYGNTAMHIAAYNNDADMFEILMNLASDLDVKNGKGKIPLEIAKQKKSNDVIKLIEKNEPRSLEELSHIYLVIDSAKKDVTAKDLLNVNEMSEKIEYLTKTIDALRSRIATLESKSGNSEGNTNICDQCGMIKDSNGLCPNCDTH